jgi:cyanobactin biosynthesis protein (PatB/AcyB/McaB family)
MSMPNLSPPVKRPELVHPHRTVDVHHGTPAELFAIRMALIHGANYNDPASFQPRSKGTSP